MEGTSCHLCDNFLKEEITIPTTAFLPENPDKSDLMEWYNHYQTRLEAFKKERDELRVLATWLKINPLVTVHELQLPVIVYATIKCKNKPTTRLYALLVRFEWLNHKAKTLFQQNIRYSCTLVIYEDQKQVDLKKSCEELYNDYVQKINLPLSLTFHSLSAAITKMCFRADSPFPLKNKRNYITGFRGWRIAANDQILQSLLQKDTVLLEYRPKKCPYCTIPLNKEIT